MKWVALLLLAMALSDNPLFAHSPFEPIEALSAVNSNAASALPQSPTNVPSSLSSAGSTNPVATTEPAPAPPAEVRPGIPSVRSTFWFIGVALLALGGLVMVGRKPAK